VFESAQLHLHELEVQLEEKFVRHVDRFLVDVRKGAPGLSVEASPLPLPPAHAPRGRGGGGGGGGGGGSGGGVGGGGGGGGGSEPPRDARPAAWYFEYLELSPIRVNVTYMSSQRMLQELLRNPVHIPSVNRLPLTLHALFFDVSAAREGALGLGSLRERWGG
jgi:hypothetical protein